MKKVLIIMFFVTALLSIDLSEAVKLGLENNRDFVNFKNLNQAEKKLEIRLSYIQYLENRDKLRITQKTMKYMSKFTDYKEDFTVINKKVETDFLDSKSILEFIINKKIEDINSIASIDFTKLKNTSLENTTEVQSLEEELTTNESNETDYSWNLDVHGEVVYGYEYAKRGDGRNYKQNEVQLALSLVLSKSNEPKIDTTKDKAQKLRDLENKKTASEKDIQKYQENYIEALKEYKLKKENIKQYNKKSFQTADEIKKAYIAHIDKNEALYRVYTNYAYLLYTKEK